MLTSLFPPNTGPCTTGQSCTYFFFTLCVWLSFNHWLVSFLRHWCSFRFSILPVLKEKKAIFRSHSYFLKEMGNISRTCGLFDIFKSLEISSEALFSCLRWSFQRIMRLNELPHLLSARGNLEILASLYGSHSLITIISHFITTFLLMPLAKVWISIRLKITTA